MRSRLVHEAHGQRTFVVVLETGDEAMSELKCFAGEQNLSAAQITAIGAFSRAVISYFDWEKKEYLKIPVAEQVEVQAGLANVGGVRACDGLSLVRGLPYTGFAGSNFP